MDTWTRVVIEWINCLEIAQRPVEDLHDLQDCLLYQKIVSQLYLENGHDSPNLATTRTTTTTTTTTNVEKHELVSEFIKAEYPEFMVDGKCGTDITYELYIASLLLTQCSQKATFHRPMCSNLKHETQIYIKKFLELVLPYGKSLTREIVETAIMEIGDATPNDPTSTPVIRPLREFFNSPAAKSAYRQSFINDRNRELRHLKAKLETEQYEKADLAEDIKKQDEKIQNLQKKLHEKSQELKMLRMEKFQPGTPQSNRKKRPSEEEKRYKREAEKLENANFSLQLEIERLQNEQEELSRRFTTKDRMHAAVETKFYDCERNLEALKIQLEIKSYELLTLRINNEELQNHIREIQRSSMGEQSFEMEPIGRSRSPQLLNCSEALSSIIDIQLQEAKEESIQLKNQLDGVNKRLEIALSECQEIGKLNEVLQEKVKQYEIISESLRDTQIRLDSCTEKSDYLEREKFDLIANLEKLDQSLSSNKKSLDIAEKRRETLESELACVTTKSQHLEDLVNNEKARKEELEETLTRFQNKHDELQTQLESTENQLRHANNSQQALEIELEDKLKKLNESESNLMNKNSRVAELETIIDCTRKESEDLKSMLETSVQNYSLISREKEQIESNLQKKINELTTELESTIARDKDEYDELKKIHILSEENLSRVNKEIEQVESKLNEKIKQLEESEIRLNDEKIRAAELESTIARDKEEYEEVKKTLVLSEKNVSRLNKDKEELEFNLTEEQKNLELTKSLLCNEKTKVNELELNITSITNEMDNLKLQIDSSDKELSNLRNLNESLESNLGEITKRLENSEVSLNDERIFVATLETTITRIERESNILADELRLTKDSLTKEKSRVTELELTASREEKNAQLLRETLDKLKDQLEIEKLTSIELKKSTSAELKKITDISNDARKEIESLLHSKEQLLEETTLYACSLKAELETSRQQIDDLQSSLEIQFSKVAELESNYKSEKDNCSNLRDELASEQLSLEETEIKRANTEAQLLKLNAEIRVIETNFAKIREELLKVEEDRKESHLAKEKSEEYARNIDAKVISLEVIIENYESNINKLDAKSIEQIQNIEILETNLANKNLTINEITARLEKMENCEKANLVELESAGKQIAELTELGEEVESQLIQEREQLAAIQADKKSLEEKLEAYVHSEIDLRQQIDKIVKEFEESEIKFKEQININDELKKNLSILENAKNALENKLEMEQLESAVLTKENLEMKEELASLVDSTANLKIQIEIIEKELEVCNEKLRIQFETNVGLENEKIELEKVINELEIKLTDVKEELGLTRVDKDALNQEYLASVQDAMEIKEKIINLSENLEDLSKRNDEQCEIIVSLKNKNIEIEKLRTIIENTLIEERDQFNELKNEKEMLEEEASLYGRSNSDLGNEIILLQSRLDEFTVQLENERLANVGSEKVQIELNNEKKILENELENERKKLSDTVNDIKKLHEKLNEYEKCKADMIEEISALHTELEASRNDHQQFHEINTKLKEKITNQETHIESLEEYESKSLQLNNDLDLERSDCAALRILVDELSYQMREGIEEIEDREDKIKQLEKENNIYVEHIESLEERLSRAEKLYEDSKIEDKSIKESLNLIKLKLEESEKDKIESELRMKEIIVNLQEVRSSQDGVLEAQIETLNDKSHRLEEVEKELVSLKDCLTIKANELEREKLINRDTQLECEKLKEHREIQSILVKELEMAIDIQRNEIEETTKRCKILESDARKIGQLSSDLKLELNNIWNLIGKSCPEIVRSGEIVDNSDKKCSLVIIESFADDVKTIFRAISTLNETNDKLKSNMREIVQVSECLKLELNALWNSVRRACPELARPSDEDNSASDHQKIPNSPKITEISYAVKTFANEAKNIRKAVSILSEANETLKEHLDGEKEITKNTAKQAEITKLELADRINNMEIERKKRDDYLSFIVKRKKNLEELLKNAVTERDQVDERLVDVTEKWKIVTEKSNNFLSTGSSACDELKHLQLMRTELDDILSSINDKQTRSSKPLLKSLCRLFAWSELKFEEAENSIVKCEFSNDNELIEERELVESEIQKSDTVKEEISAFNEKIVNFSKLLDSYEASLRSGAIKRATTAEEKLQSQLDKLTKERKEFKEKLDTMRMRNAKMEKNLDDLRNENKKLKTESTNAATGSENCEELENARTMMEKLQIEVTRLERENDDLTAAAKQTGNSDVSEIDTRLQQVHNEYGLKLEKIKQKMKTAYNEQIAKLNMEQEKAVKDKIDVLRAQMETQRRKYTEDIAKYKAHISDLSSRYWDVGEKLLAETQEKQLALQRLEHQRETQDKYKHEPVAQVNQQNSIASRSSKTTSLDRRDFATDRATRDGPSRPGYRAVQVIEEETTTYSTRRHSVKSIQAMGNAFNAEDEESEIFDSVYLADLKEGRCAPIGPDFDRLSELRMRNSMCRPHLKSSYAVETHFQPIALNEDDIKNGVTGDDMFNDSLSQSLLPGQKPKKKDRTQTSYKRPGPPTPSKNGGRLSLQGNELKSPSSRVLRERNVERRTTATPRGLKNLFGTSISKRQDENATGTPKGRRLSNIFRKQRPERN